MITESNGTRGCRAEGMACKSEIGRAIIMQIKQLSVFLENKPGRLADITELLAESHIDIRAISVADTSDFGILRIIVDKPDEAVAILKEAGMTVSLSKVIAVGIGDITGEFAKSIRILADSGISVEYVYAFVSRDKGRAYVIIRADDTKRAAEVLAENGIEILCADALYNM